MFVLRCKGLKINENYTNELSLSIYLSVCLSVCLSDCLSVCLPACLSARLPACLSVCLSVCVCVCVCLSVSLSIYLSIYLSTYAILRTYLPTYLPTYLSTYICLTLSLSLSLVCVWFYHLFSAANGVGTFGVSTICCVGRRGEYIENDLYGFASKFRYGSARSDPDVWIGLDHLRFGMDRGYGSVCGFKVWIGALYFDSQPYLCHVSCRAERVAYYKLLSYPNNRSFRAGYGNFQNDLVICFVGQREGKLENNFAGLQGKIYNDFLVLWIWRFGSLSLSLSLFSVSLSLSPLSLSLCLSLSLSLSVSLSLSLSLSVSLSLSLYIYIYAFTHHHVPPHPQVLRGRAQWCRKCEGDLALVECFCTHKPTAFLVRKFIPWMWTGKLESPGLNIARLSCFRACYSLTLQMPEPLKQLQCIQVSDRNFLDYFGYLSGMFWKVYEVVSWPGGSPSFRALTSPNEPKARPSHRMKTMPQTLSLISAAQLLPTSSNQHETKCKYESAEWYSMMVSLWGSDFMWLHHVS